MISDYRIFVLLFIFKIETVYSLGIEIDYIVLEICLHVVPRLPKYDLFHRTAVVQTDKTLLPYHASKS